MSGDFWGLVGIIATLFIGIIGFFFAKTIKKVNQRQSVGDGSKGMQAGGDIKIGKLDD